MRSDPRDYRFVAPGALPAVVGLLAEDPGGWLPVAGGTDVMVLYAAGKLAARKLVSIGNLPELRQIDVLPGEIRIGAACTYTQIRRHEVIQREFPLLGHAASWTGSIANQNRGTLGGNIANASPAADSLPALLVYEAELLLVSARAERRVPYLGFHTGYKRMNLEPDELVCAVCLPRKFEGHFSYARKVGARNAQAIAKVAIAAIGRMRKGKVESARIALASVAPVPLRLTGVEQAISEKVIDQALVELAKATLASEIQPIDDIRSTASYRAAVAGNLVTEFLENLRRGRGA
jgi:CO/xanthine dehydrogenase FAD-binding subunit